MRSENRASTYTIKSSINLIKKVTPTLEVVQREKGNNVYKTWTCSFQENMWALTSYILIISSRL